MKKDEFLEQLVYLLQDIPDGEREEAIQYYRDYLEEAGSENEEQTVEEFGSPERVAAIIRADLAGNLNDGGSFTEKGYEDERFRDPNYEIAKRLDLPEAAETASNSGTKHDSGRVDGSSYRDHMYTKAGQDAGRQGAAYGNGAYQDSMYQDGGYRDSACGSGAYQNGTYQSGAYQSGTYQDGTYQSGTYQSGPYQDGFQGQYENVDAHTKRRRKPWTNRPLKWILWIILLCVASPVILGVGGTVFSLIVGVFSIILGIFAVIAVMTIGMIVVGVIAGSLGLTLIGVNFMDSMFLMGLSMASFGCGILGVVLSWLVLGCFLPFLWKIVVKIVCAFTKKRKGGKGNE